MQNFQMPTQVKLYDSVREFIENMSIAANDLIITTEAIYSPFFKDYDLACRVIFQENYGEGEPNDRMLSAIIRDIDGYCYGRVIAIGGGTVIDIAKILALICISNMPDILYGRTPLIKNHKLIAVPTTCGTGSEVSNIAIIEDTDTHIKKAVVGPALFPDEAVLVPELLKRLPQRIFTLSSIDALVTAVESYLAPSASPITEMFSLSALQKILTAYELIAHKGNMEQSDVVGEVLVASNFAGIAFCNTGVGAVHAMSYPLGAKYHVPHGEATYSFLEVVLKKYDEINPDGKIRSLKKVLADIFGEKDESRVFTLLAELLEHIIPLKKLHEYGIEKNEIYEFGKEVNSLDRLMKNNYVRLTMNDIIDMFESRY